MFLRDLQSGFLVRFLARENGIGLEVTGRHLLSATTPDHSANRAILTHLARKGLSTGQ